MDIVARTKKDTVVVKEDDMHMEVRFYRMDSGNEPVREWLKGLPRQERKIIDSDIKTVQYGWPLGMPVVRKLEPGLWESRSCTCDAAQDPRGERQ